MRFLFLSRTFPPDAGAVGHLVKELGGALVEKGHQVTVMTAGKSGRMEAPDSLIRVVRVGGLPISRQSHWKRALSYLSLYPALLWKAARQPRPDLIVTTTDPPLQAVLGVALKAIFRCKLVHWCQDIYPELAEEGGVTKKGGLLANLLRRISTAALKRHDRIVSIGRCMTARLLKRGLPPARIIEIPNWTDPEWIRPMSENENRFLERENLRGRFVVVYSGNLGLAHSFTEILDAAQELQKIAADVLFLFIGEGPRRKEVEQEATARMLQNVRFLPAQSWETLPESLSAGQVHLVSLRENLCGLVVPSKFYGGIAAGRPCLFIGPAESEVAQLILEHSMGKVIQPGDSAGLGRAILNYRNNLPQWQEDGQRARHFAEGATLRKSTAQFGELSAMVVVYFGIIIKLFMS